MWDGSEGEEILVESIQIGNLGTFGSSSGKRTIVDYILHESLIGQHSKRLSDKIATLQSYAGLILDPRLKCVLIHHMLSPNAPFPTVAQVYNFNCRLLQRPQGS